MTTPERGLSEQIRGLLPITGCFTNIEKICAQFEQRLAEAETACDLLSDDMRNLLKIMAKLRARCGELENIAHKANAVNEHWNEFGPEHGFDERMDHLHSALTATPQPAQEQK